MSDAVLVDTKAGVTTVRLNRPPLNTFDDGLRQELSEAIRPLADDDSVGAVVLAGNDRAFAAGADLKQLVTMNYEQISVWNRALQRVFTEIAQLPMPVVAAVDGYALGGGLELALAADFRILGANAQLALPEVQLGILPGAGGVQRLRRLVGASRAKELLMSGRRVSAEEAVDIGLAERVVPGAELLSTAQEFAATLAGGPRFALRAIKEAVDLGEDSSLAAGLALDRNLLAGLFATADREIGMASFLEHGPGRATFGRGEESA
ncbi:enoyl-CoA hydratase/isomerase family protein [Nocardia carnea]|uniref:enoyl-CoA hydratase/isomerase family protein n=1 Tax=Nocardia carnea TaxID=37328 RepID=UPI00245383CF|nr:enoyl-CoA hydratase-related protein [Nocardia carnea]